MAKPDGIPIGRALEIPGGLINDELEPKVELKNRTGKSPDFAEVLMLPFTPCPPEPAVLVI